jgi:hypothetical protein
MLQANPSSLRMRLLATAAVLAISAASALAQGAANPGSAAPPAAAPPVAPGAPGASEAAGADAAAVAASSSDWPCVQVKVHTIDSAAVWDGPSIEGLKGYTDDDALYNVVSKVVSRRTPVAEAEKAVEDYAKSIPEAERDQKLTLLFSGVLDTANTQRSGIVNGIERYQKRQRSNAKEIETQGEAIADLESKAPSDLTVPTPELDAAREKYDWFARVFQERQGNIPIACEIPTLIEQRVFAVARAIRAQMKS